ncbi:MAG: PaaI family thioesterase [Desulfarculaceae bacterium]|nr:PaaI family thioesterase [Desulfarculaceae bacterium]MCF8071101.1 PaaI family thioesterase [Desulfarculaceae bacterium]MCF8100689.1 PaaI family thioesterase [Desulfarculaceae bacterium]MCF8118173.1 PaaI family thioesterase [Desulfarculaceae bacterium]
MNFIQSYYDPQYATCFGCGQANPQGLRIQSYWDGEFATCGHTPGPEQMAYPGVVYGGLIASLIDCHSIATAIAAAYQAEGRPMDSRPPIAYVTGNLNVSYLAPAPLGPELELKAWISQATPKKSVVQCELSAEGKLRARGETIAVRYLWAG